jgi:hypothetical protein
MRTDAMTDAGYREHFAYGQQAGKDALRVMTETDLAVTRLQVTRIAANLESAWYDAAYARGFLAATNVVPEFRQWQWQAPSLRRRLRGW